MKYILLYINLLFFTLGVNAQQDSLKVQYDNSVVEQKKIDTKSLEKYKSDKEFNYDVKKREPSFLERVWNWTKRMLLKVLSWLFGVGAATGILAIIINILPYLIAAIVLFLLIKFFLKVNMNNLISGKTDKAVVNLSKEEELIKNEDLSLLIKDAIAQKNYRLAIRYYYLLVLQKLSKHDIIDWQQQKTNEDYIKEIQSNKLKDKFATSTYLYDFVWYGNFEINELEFSKAQIEFVKLNELINKFG